MVDEEVMDSPSVMHLAVSMFMGGMAVGLTVGFFLGAIFGRASVAAERSK